MTLTEWFLAELESEAAKTRRVLAEVPEGKREWKPHDRSMAFGYLTDLVANILSWVGLAITLDELDIAPKSGPSYRPVPAQTSVEAIAALDKAVAQARAALRKTDDAHLATSWRLLAGGTTVMEQRRHDVARVAPATFGSTNCGMLPTARSADGSCTATTPRPGDATSPGCSRRRVTTPSIGERSSA